MNTVCRYFCLDPNGKVQHGGPQYAWEDPTDRTGDGEAEFDAFIEASRDNGADIIREYEISAWNADIDHELIKVFRCEWGDQTPPVWFGLAVVPKND